MLVKIKKYQIKTLLLTLLLIFIAGIFYIRVTEFQWCWPNPFVTTNPHSPHYKPENFCLGNYKDETLREAFGMTFPPGTQKETVDAIMGKSGCHPAQSKNYSYEVRYICPRKFHPSLLVVLSGTRSWKHLFLFASDKRLINIHPGGMGDKIFEEMPGKLDLRQKEKK